MFKLCSTVLLIAFVSSLAEGHRRPWNGAGRPRPGGFFNAIQGILFPQPAVTPPRLSKAEFDAIWTSTGTVPDRLSQVPDQPLYMQFGDISVTPNMTLDTAQLQKKPKLEWNADPNALYTVLIEDNDIVTSPIKYAHWLVTNIPGNDVNNGDEVAEYLPSFHFVITPDGQLEQTLGVTDRHLVLVYKQKGKIDMSGQSGCNAGLLEAPRVIDHDQLQADYDLEGPVAGNFYRNGYSKGYTEEMLCYYSKCLGTGPFPFPLPGINDGPECTQ